MDSSKLKTAAHELEQWAGNYRQISFKCARMATDAVAPAVRAAIMSNYRASGIKDSTGTLARIIASDLLVVFPFVKAGKPPVIYVTLPPNLPDEVYRYANALNYGATHNGSMKWKYNKETGGRSGPWSIRARMKFKANRGEGQHGGTRVTHAYNFFQLSQAQEAALQSQFEQIYNALLEKEIGK